MVSKQLVASRHGTETLTARLNTAANSSYNDTTESYEYLIILFPFT